MSNIKVLQDSLDEAQSNIIIYNTLDGKAAVALYAVDGKIWLNQMQMAELFATSKQSISYHISNILNEGELKTASVVKDFLTTARDNKQYHVIFYSLEMILAVGYRVKGKRGTQFRQNVLLFNNKDVLQGKGNISNSEMEASVIAEYQKFDSRRKKDEALKADQEDAMILDEIIEKTKSLE